MEKFRDATLAFLIKKYDGHITEVCLAMKKRGFGMGRWNAVGGKVHTAEGESIEDATKRETLEEIGATIVTMHKVAELTFTFPHRPEWNQTVHSFFAEDWLGEPIESDEMAPQWFPVNELPYSQMWPSDIFWVPQIIEGKKVRGEVSFGEGDTVVTHEVSVIDSL